MPSLSEQEKIKLLEDFLSMAFCIDGEAKFDKFLKIDKRDSMQFKLTDEKRGIFYVSMSK